MQRQEITIIGGGAAGFFAAIRCAENYPGASICILERGKDVLQKVRISGGGRCNLTHACYTPKELVQYYPRGHKALLGPFHQFACGDTVEWFEKRGVLTKVEPDGRIFPKSNRSQTILDCLQNRAKHLGIDVKMGHRLVNIEALDQGQGGYVLHFAHNKKLQTDILMLATGSSPKIWDLLEQMGHTIIKPVPSLFTFKIKDDRLNGLAGISVPKATLCLPKHKKLQASGPLLVTHWGLSGPAVLRLSAWGARILSESDYRFELVVNYLPEQEESTSFAFLQEQGRRLARKQIYKKSCFGLSLRLWQAMLRKVGVSETLQWANLSKKQKQAIVGELHRASFLVSGKSTFKEEFVTAGGVSLKEVNFKRFESKLFNNLFFAGEVLDIDAVTGGFNFQAAWTGGWLAGQAMGISAQNR